MAVNLDRHSPLRQLMLYAVVLVAGLSTFNSNARAGKRVALVIGNSNYRYVERLDNPSNDARLIAKALRSVGFTIVGGGPYLNLDKQGFQAAVEKFGDALQGARVGLFYYAGHGLALHGTNYLVPVDANPVKPADVNFQLISANAVLDEMTESGTRLNMVLLDACRNNPFGGRGLRAVTAGLTQMQAPEGTLISFATQPGHAALDGSNGDSPYAKALAKTIATPGLGLFETFNQIALRVKKETGKLQQPWMSSSPISGTFYFAGAPATPKTVDEASKAWAAVKETTDVAVLQAFIRHYGNTVYGALAQAKLKTLKTTKVATLEPSVEPERETLSRTISLKGREKWRMRYIYTPSRMWRNIGSKRHVSTKTGHDDSKLGESITFKNGKVIVDGDYTDKPGIYTIECGNGHLNVNSHYPRMHLKGGVTNAVRAECKYTRAGDAYDIMYGYRNYDFRHLATTHSEGSYVSQEWKAKVYLDSTKCRLISFSETFTVDRMDVSGGHLTSQHSIWTPGECVAVN